MKKADQLERYERLRDKFDAGSYEYCLRQCLALRTQLTYHEEDVRRLVALCCEHLGQWDQALGAWNSLVDKYPSYSQHCLERARCLDKLGMTGAAQSLLELAVSQHDRSSRARADTSVEKACLALADFLHRHEISPERAAGLVDRSLVHATSQTLVRQAVTLRAQIALAAPAGSHKRRRAEAEPDPEGLEKQMSALHEELRKRPSLTCVVCEVETRSVRFDPCGHVACCGGCALPLSTCPLCQAVFHDRQKVFF